MNDSNRQFAVDFHVHTSHSYDCMASPKTVIEMARRRGLDGVAITDHDTVRGALATLEANRYDDFLVIPGIEVKSDRGDIIGLYVTSEIQSRNFAEVIAEIHSQGGLAYLPHPIRTFGAKGAMAVHGEYPEIDIWEAYNGRYDSREFAAAHRLIDELAVEAVCGSDAHAPWEVGIFRTLLPHLPKDAPALLSSCPSANLVATPRRELARRVGITLGEATGKMKRGEYSQLGLLLASLPWKALRRSLRAVGHR